MGGLVFAIILCIFLIFTIFIQNTTESSKCINNSSQEVLSKRYNPNISRITSDLFLTDAKNALDYDALRDYGVQQILTVGSELSRHGEPYFRVMHVKVNDVPSENIRKHFNSTFNFIKRGRTLIHCAAGISRSPTILAAYLMRKDKVTHRQALRRIAKKRPCISPNPGFIEQLKQFEDDLKQKSNASDTEATAT